MAIAPRIMLLAIGSLGDVHPLLALGIAARERGAEVTVGVAEEHVNSVRDAGLTPVAMVESLDRAGARVGLDKQDTRRLTLQLTGWFVNQHMVPNLRGMIEALAPSMDGQDIVCGNPLAIAAPIVAELYGLPFVPVRLQPAISLPNGFEMPQATKPVHPYPTPQERRTNTWRAAQQVAALRKSFDLPDRPPLTLLGPHGDMPMTLGLFSSLMAGFKDQFVPDFKITGFPLYDGSGGQGQLEERLERFLSDGPPPAVFTLGSYVPDLGQNFYHDSLEAARRLGLRSVLLTGPDWTGPREGADFIVCDYVPHSKLFPRARLIVHHGGIGTTAQALHSGRPQCIVPFAFDQPSNGFCLADKGVALTMPLASYRVDQAAAMLAECLTPEAETAATEAAHTVRSETGAEGAADLLMAWLAERQPALQ